MISYTCDQEEIYRPAIWDGLFNNFNRNVGDIHVQHSSSYVGSDGCVIVTRRCRELWVCYRHTLVKRCALMVH